MPLLETLAIKVSSSIAKAILKRWLKDSPVADGASSSLIDIFQSKTNDILAQRRGNRQFEEIGEKVAMSFLPIFEDGSNHVDEGGRTSVAMAVAETLDNSSIDSRVLVETNLDPSKLEKYLVDSNSNITRDFSEPETSLYKRIISEASQCIVDIASQLPSFTERTFGEILSRESTLLNVTNDILQEIQHLRENSRQANPEAEAAHFETEYRRAIIRNLDEVELFGVDVSPASRRHRLSVAYVTLSVEQKAFNTSEQQRKRKKDESDRVTLPVDEALAESRCLLIRGLAGSGKTTLLKWIAVRSAFRSLEGRLADWDVIPFFIQLRRYVDLELPRPEHFPGLVTPALAENMPQGWVHKQLQSGRAVVLVDGIDEAPEAQRSNVRKWLKDLVELYTEARFIVTSRPHAIGEGWMEREGFVDAELLPMELPDIETFIDHWHDAVGEELREQAEIAVLTSLRENLKKVVRRVRPIRELATNPLLCSMLSALHRDRHQRLPQDRIEIYEACCHALIERLDLERGVKLQGYPQLNYRQKRTLLQDFAYWLLSNGWSEVAIDRADKRLELKLTNMRDLLQTVTGVDARKLFVDRSGIIREAVPGRIDFIHRTFQEFLAAAAAVDEGNIGVLTKNAHDDQWWETISLAAGLAHKSAREELIKALIQRGDEERTSRHQLHLLAVACLEASIEIGTDLAAEVQKRLADLVPPKSKAEAKSLAAAGELALPYLTATSRHSASVSAACVRTLALISGEKALEVLTGYGRDLRRAVVNELLRAWDYFEPEPYARQILSSGTSLRLGPTSPYFPSAFEKLSHLTYVETLNLSGCIQIKSIQPLADMPNLTVIDLSSCSQIGDLDVLSRLPKLATLNLSGCLWLDDLWALHNLNKLSTLSLQGCSKIEDLEALANLTSLTDLNLSNCLQIEELEPLAGLTKLKTLNLSGCSQIDLRPLAGLTNLTTLDLSGGLWLSDLWAICYLHKLTTLNLQGCSFSNEPLFLLDLRNLITLSLQECSWVRDLKILEGLSRLTTLNLSSCSQVKDLKPLEKLVNLTTLDLSGCSQIEDLEPLASLPKLTTLNLSGCRKVRNSNLMGRLPNLIV